jgi:glycosyltransferase involved in cell wall biosynthesis
MPTDLDEPRARRRLWIVSDAPPTGAGDTSSVCRGLAACLARGGWDVTAYGPEAPGGAGTAGPHGLPDATAGEVVSVDRRGVRVDRPVWAEHSAGGVRSVMLRGLTASPGEAGAARWRAFLDRVEADLGGRRPDAVLVHGGDALVRAVTMLAARAGVPAAVALRGNHRDASAFAHAAAVIAPSEFAARYHRDALGLDCTALPYPVDPDRTAAEPLGPGYVTFIDPTPSRGLYPFARVADELGRLRPDVPLLVVESEGEAAALDACGLDLSARGNLSVLPRVPDPRTYWSVTRVCLTPWLGWEDHPAAAAEALLNGIPVVASDRGALPETLGGAGVVLSLPDRLTPATRSLPTAEEVRPWVEAVIRLWDDQAHYEEARRRALAEAPRWDPAALLPRYERLLAGLRQGRAAADAAPPGRGGWLTVVVYRDAVGAGCEAGLRGLERAGVRVERVRDWSGDDVALSRVASGALAGGVEALLLVDPGVGFDAADALRLLARPEPVVAGVYDERGLDRPSCVFADDPAPVVFGPGAEGAYPLASAPAGFLRVRADALRRVAEALDLPLCDAASGPGFRPFFQPLVVPADGGGARYLGPAEAFSRRLALAGFTPLADTSVRLHRPARYLASWEDVYGDPVWPGPPAG